MPAGRPKKTLNDLQSDWKEKIIYEMSQGAGKEEIQAILGMSQDWFERMIEECEEFSVAIKRGLELSRLWWMRTGRQNLVDEYQGNRFNATLWYMNMKNRFGWKDKHEISGDPERPIRHKVEISKLSDEELDREIAASAQGRSP